MVYVILVTVIGGICIHYIELDYSQVSFIDAIFLCVSGGTGTGLSTNDVYFMKTSSQFIVSICITICGVAFASVCIPSFIRYYRLKQIIPPSEETTECEEYTSTDEKDDVIQIDIITSETSPYKYNYSVELGAVKLFCIIAVMYTLVCQFIVFMIIFIDCYCNKNTYDVLTKDKTSPFFFSYFITVSAWNNAGLSINSPHLQISSDYVIVISITILSILGNCGIPIGIRYTIFVLHRLTEPRNMKILTKNLPYLYILKSPTRISAYLFSSTQTKLLLVIFFLLLFVQTMFFVLLNRDCQVDYVLVLGLAQAGVTRTAGFQFVSSFAELHDIVNIIYIFTMFVGSYPIQMIRDYRDKQVSIQAGYFPNKSNLQTMISYFSDIIFSHAMIVFFFTIFVMAVVAMEKPEEHTALTVLFEVTSAFGTVGYSLGYQNKPYSFSGGLSNIGKISIIVVMLLGRVRGFPSQLYPPDYYKTHSD
ncbi:cation transporter, putative [Entamoeba invadens IP1]|uniref:cation transporter, putative n=1 Tax=Entamoeba invadens IP1 TaxID=370355 RepID=UPI0002C3F076|nr:cation transporter, putative [Entamoeba invadens IP1]ELP94196.1 cation transporter, putative [Entamoeba invadens IP1]|eukprot:XP_004260967.1 cation transporter, putative [Entamoeba invadens IP1]